MAMVIHSTMPIALVSKDEEIDLEDGEIEDDDEEVVNEPPPSSTVDANPPPKPSPPKIQPPIIEAPSKAQSKKISNKSRTKAAASVLNVRNHSEVALGEDDWANNVEKAIRAAMGNEDVEEKGDENKEVEREEDDERRVRKKKKRKRHRDEDGEERKESKKRKRHHHLDSPVEDFEENDDDEMLFVRGASPILRERERERERDQRSSQSPPPGYQDDPYLYPDEMNQYDEMYDSYDDESDMDDYVESEGRGRGRGGGKRRGSGRGGGLMRGGRKFRQGPPQQRLGMKRKMRADMKQDRGQGGDSVCKYYMQGKCQKGDDCPYSHDANPPRKMELCKFYLMDCCAKKDKCLYMHTDFPCKFFHTGLRCFTADNCKFSHGPLTDVSKAILLRHLETAPKEILGDFPRLSREGAAQMVNNRSKRDVNQSPAAAAARSIPSLLDMEVSMPANMMPRDDSPGRRSTPMPSDNEEPDVSIDPPSATKSPAAAAGGKRHRNRWDSGDETNKQAQESLSKRLEIVNRKAQAITQELNQRAAEAIAGGHDMKNWNTVHEANKQRWDEEIRRKVQQQKLQQSEAGNEQPRWEEDDGKRDDAGNSSEKRKRRAERWKEKKQTREDNRERRREQRAVSDKRRQHEGEERHGSKQSTKDKGMEAETEMRPSYKDQDFNEQLDQLKPMMRGMMRKEGDDTQSKRLLRLAGYSGSPPQHQPDADVDDRDSSDRKPSVDESALVIDTPEEDEQRELEAGNKQEPAADDKPTDTSMPGEPAAEEPVIPAHLPKKQQELFLRIQQQQREQGDNKDGGSESSDAEDLHEESWYSSDEDEPPAAAAPAPAPAPSSLSSVLKGLSGEELTQLTAVPDVSEAVNKLLSSIMQPQVSPVMPKTEPAPQAPVTRDPRVASRDPRKRPSSEAPTSLHSPNTFDASSSRTGDPRSQRRTSRSIYDSISLPTSDTDTASADIDLRSVLAGPRDLDLREQFGDTDLRLPGPLTPNLLTAKLESDGGDIDLRRLLPFKPAPLHAAATEIEAGFHSHPPIPYRVHSIVIPAPDYSKLKFSSADVMVRADPRLRRLFKLPVASSPASPPPESTSTAPAPARADPRRLARTLDAQQPQEYPQQDYQPSLDYQPAQDYQQQQQMMMMQDQGMMSDQYAFRGDMMQRGMMGNMNMGMASQPMNFDPRMSRNTVGLLGVAPNYPGVAEPSGDTDLRMFYAGAPPKNVSAMDVQEWEQQQQQHHNSRNNRSWRGNRNTNRHSTRHDRSNNRSNNRSYTPPM